MISPVTVDELREPSVKMENTKVAGSDAMDNIIQKEATNAEPGLF